MVLSSLWHSFFCQVLEAVTQRKHLRSFEMEYGNHDLFIANFMIVDVDVDILIPIFMLETICILHFENI